MGVSVQLRRCFHGPYPPRTAREALGGVVRLRIQLDFIQEDDGSLSHTGYEVKTCSGELVALGGWVNGGPTHESVEAACREAYDQAMLDTIRNGVQESLHLDF
jgi:hypothetical protein